MIRNKRILFALGLAGLLSIHASSQVTVKDTSTIKLDEITIMAHRIPADARQFARITRTISREEIQSSPARDLAGLLEYIPDIDVRQRGPVGVQADISLRGGTFDQFAVLINGINFSDPQTGHFQMDIPVPLAMIRQIEVLSGSDVKSLGSNAFSGAINIVTGIPTEKRVHGGLSAGQYGFLEATLDARNRSKNWWQQSGVVLQKSGGYRENTDFNTLNGFFETGYRVKQVNLSLMGGGLKKAFGANSFYTAKYPDQYERTQSGFAALQAHYNGKVNISGSFYYRIHTDEFSLFRTNPPSWYLSPNYHLTQTAGSKSDAWFSTAWGKTAFGLEFRHESVWSTVLGELSEEPRPVTGIEGVNYTHRGSRDHFSLSAEQQVITGKFTWNGGVVFHQVRAAKNYFQTYPGLDVSYSLTSALRTYLSVNRAFRLPTFTEMYYTSPTNRGNAELMPETAWHSEIGAEYRLGGFSSRLMGFYRYGSQSIDWVRTADETVWHTENLGKIRTSGIETGLTYRPLQMPQLYKIIDRVDVGYRQYFQHHAVESYFSQYVLDYLKWKMTAGLTLKAGAPFRITVNLVWQERNGTYTAFDAAMNPLEVDYKPFAVVDLKLLYRFRWVTLTAECSNIFNQGYFDLGSVPQPGAWYKAGLEFNLIGKH